MQAIQALGGDVADVLVLPGDTALVTGKMLVRLIEAHASDDAAATLLTANAQGEYYLTDVIGLRS